MALLHAASIPKAIRTTRLHRFMGIIGRSSSLAHVNHAEHDQVLAGLLHRLGLAGVDEFRADGFLVVLSL